jgi:acetyltransferase-like isoleucine patch superfamily enzyme
MLIKNKRIPILSLILIGFLPSFVKKWIYRLKGYQIGKGVKIGLGSIITGKTVVIEQGAEIDFFTFIICEECLIESNVKIGSFVYFKVDKISIGFQTVIRESNLFGGMDIGKSELKIGHMSHIHQKCLINTTLPVSIGNYTAIGGGSYLFTHSSWQSVLKGYPCTFDPITIGDNVWISWNTFILPGVKIGNGTLVSASAVVSKSLPEKCLAAGNPAKPIIPSGLFPREPHPDEKIDILINILYVFREFLEKKGLVVSIENNDSYTLYKITKKNTLNYLYFLKAKDLIISEIDTSVPTVVLSLKEISAEIIEATSSKKICIVDISTEVAYNLNSIGLELLKFLKHYGIHLKYNN